MDRIYFKINGEDYTVGSEVTSDVMLLDYIRYTVNLRGTKYMCRQAGCGACIVAAKKPGGDIEAINSCMVSITSCQDWEIQTIEALGNRKKGYHVIQETLAKYNGSQCGYCSPGWVMSMYCLLHEKKELTMLDVETSFASNICRCTGYRPILEAFKTFAKDCPQKTYVPDIEDLSITCSKTGRPCAKTCSGDKNNIQNDVIREEVTSDDDWCFITNNDYMAETIKIVPLKDGRKCYYPKTLENVHSILQREGFDCYMLMGGNTGKGAYPILEYPRILIDINGIHDLKTVVLDQNLVIGAGVTLTKLLSVCCDISQNAYFEYLKEFHEHLKLFAHIAVRNLGTIRGNLMIKHQHNEFPSDIYLMFETVGAQLTISKKN